MKKAHSISSSSVWITKEVHSQDISVAADYLNHYLLKKQDGEGELEEQSPTISCLKSHWMAGVLFSQYVKE